LLGDKGENDAGVAYHDSFNTHSGEQQILCHIQTSALAQPQTAAVQRMATWQQTALVRSIASPRSGGYNTGHWTYCGKIQLKP
jgi:hypothetical protein